MASAEEIAAMRENVVAPDSTLALLVDLRKMGGGTCKEAADLIEWFIDDRATWQQALAEERRMSAHFEKDATEMVGRLFRLSEHLRDGIVREVMHKLADYAGAFKDYEAGIGYDGLDDPPPDPFPEPAPAPKRRRRKGV